MQDAISKNRNRGRHPEPQQWCKSCSLEGQHLPKLLTSPRSGLTQSDSSQNEAEIPLPERKPYYLLPQEASPLEEWCFNEKCFLLYVMEVSSEWTQNWRQLAGLQFPGISPTTMLYVWYWSFCLFYLSRPFPLAVLPLDLLNLAMFWRTNLTIYAFTNAALSPDKHAGQRDLSEVA